MMTVILSHSLAGGADELLFNVNAQTGELSFLAAPSFASPQDFDRDNIYEVRIAVGDGFSSITRLMAIEVQAQ